MAIPHTANCDIESTLSQPVKLRGWQLAGLPTDSLSTQNGIVMDKARRWPLLIDPQVSYLANYLASQLVSRFDYVHHQTSGSFLYMLGY